MNDDEWREAQETVSHAKHIAEQQGYEDVRHGVNLPDRTWSKDYARGRQRYFEESE